MQYLTGILTALLLSVLAYCLVIITLNMAIRGLTRGGNGFPLLPKYAAGDGLPLTGLDFEEFVVERFDPGHFRIMRWSKKYAAGESFTDAASLPDLEYQALVHKQVIPFAIECEWRPGFSNGAIDLSGFQVFPAYRKAGSDRNMPVFLIIGIGGSQADPSECYIVPMDVIQPHFTFLSKEFLGPFRRQQAGSVLFLDVNKMILH